MKKVIYASLALSVFAFASCTKNDVKTETSATQGSNKSVKKLGSISPYVMSVKYTRDMVMQSNGKYDCSKSGDNCNVNKRPNKLMLDQLAVLDTYVASGNSGAYFQGNNWQIIFPEITEAGIAALTGNEIHIYKKESNDETSSYVLSSAQSSDGVNADNVIAVWQY